MEIVFSLIVDLTLLVTFAYSPILRKEEAFFGVRISKEDYQGAGRKLLHRYWVWLTVIFLSIEVISLIGLLYKDQGFHTWVGASVLLPAALILYILFYRCAKVWEVIDTNQRFSSALKVRYLRDYTNIVMEAIILIMMLASTSILAYYYPLLPERIPIHWNLQGEPDNWAAKSFTTVFLLPITMGYLQGLFLLIKHGLLQTKMTLPAEQREQYLHYKEEMLKLTMQLMDCTRILTTIMLSSISLAVIFTTIERLRFLLASVFITSTAITLIMLVMGVYYVYQFITIDRKLKAATGRVYVQRPKDAAHWYGGGFFYYNPDDPALFVEKLVGFGYTFNLANKRLYIYCIYIIVLPLTLGWILSMIDK